MDHIPQDYLSKAWKSNLLCYILENTPYLKDHIDQLITLYYGDCEDYTNFLKLIKKLIPEENKEKESMKWDKVFRVNYYTNVRRKKSYLASICYVARYSRRLPIAKSKIIKWDKIKQEVVWNYRPHGRNTSSITETIPVNRFFERIIQHIRPKHFRLIRYNGIFATKSKLIFGPILKRVCIFEVPKKIPLWRERIFQYSGKDPLICQKCKQEMQLTEKAYRTPLGSLKVIPVKY